MEDYRTQAANGKRWCYDCKHYRTSCMCGYEASECDIHGSLDVDQKERHPDETADTCPDYTPNGKKPWWMKYEEREKENMTMENMVKTLENQGFYVEKTYNRKLRVYEFYIEKDSIAVAGKFEYPKSAHYPLVDRAQRVFIEDLVREWNKGYAEKNKKGESNMATHEWTDPETGKKYGYSWGYDIKEKGESNMKNNDNLMYALAQTTAGHLEIMGKKYPVMVKDVIVDGRCAGEAATLLTVEAVGRYGNPTVYELIGRALHDKADYRPKIKDVIFNPPATIVFWADNTKTVVKCQEGDIYDPEKGLTMAITKKLFGNKGNYCEEIKKWVKKYQPEPVEIHMNGFSITELGNMIREAFGLPPEKKEEPIVAETPETADSEKRWKIWWKKYDENDNVVGSGVHHTDYKCKSSARRAAHRMFDDHSLIDWWVSPENPWEEK